jgi:hypothetical protein
MSRMIASPCRLACTVLALAHMCQAWAFDKPDMHSMHLFTAGYKSDFSALRLKGAGLFPSIFGSGKSLSQKLRASMDKVSGSVGKKGSEKGLRLAGKWTKVKTVGQEEAMLQVLSGRGRLFPFRYRKHVSFRHVSFLPVMS